MTAMHAATITPIVHGCSLELDDDDNSCWPLASLGVDAAAWGDVEEGCAAELDKETLDDGAVKGAISATKEKKKLMRK